LKDSTVPKKVTVHVRLSLNAKCKQGQPLIKHGISNFVGIIITSKPKWAERKWEIFQQSMVLQV